MSNFKNIISNLFGTREVEIENDGVELVCKSADLSIDKVKILKSSKDELIKAFDAFNDSHVIEMEKSDKNEDKASIQRRLDRYEVSFLSDIKNVSEQLFKAQEDQMRNLNLAIETLGESDERREKYSNVLGKDIKKAVNHFENLSFDVDTTKLTFTETCELLSKAMEDGALNTKSEIPFVVNENEYHATLITLAKAKETNSISDDLIQKGSRRLSDLTPVRRQVVSANGTVFMKTVYVKKEEKSPEKAITYLNQKDAEENLQPGDKVNVHFKGWSSGRGYNVDKMEVKSVGDKFITVKFTEDFNTGSYTYGPNSNDQKGREVKIPTTGNEKWNQSERLELWIDPEIERNRQRKLAEKEAGRGERDLARLMKTHTGGSGNSQSNATQEVNHSDNVNTGDSVQFEKRGELIKGRVQSMWRQANGKARLEIKKLDGTTLFKTIGPETRNGSVEKIIEGDSVVNNDDGTITVKDPSKMNLDMIRQLGKNGIKFGNNSVQQTKDLYKGSESLYEHSSAKDWADKFNKSFPNFNLAEMMGDVKKEIKAAGVRNVNATVEPGRSNGGFNIYITGSGGFKMDRTFSATNDVPPQTQVYNDYFKTGDDAGRGNNVGKKLFRIYNKQYRRTGLDRMKVHAALQTGGYAWCRFGFTADKNTAQSKASRFQDRVGRSRTFRNPQGQEVSHTMTQAHADQAKKVVDEFYRNNPSTAKFPMNNLAAIGDTMAGRHVLLGDSWRGEIDLKDVTQRDTFETYIKYD